MKVQVTKIKKQKIEKIEVVKTYYVCNQCSKKILRANVISHLDKAHDLQIGSTKDKAHEFYYKELKQISLRKSTKGVYSKKHIINEIQKSLDVLMASGDTTHIICTLCDEKMPKKWFKGHCRKKHSVSINTGVPLSISNKKFDPKIGAEIYETDNSASTDIFDRSKPLHGGAYGLGKNRKH